MVCFNYFCGASFYWPFSQLLMNDAHLLTLAGAIKSEAMSIKTKQFSGAEINKKVHFFFDFLFVSVSSSLAFHMEHSANNVMLNLRSILNMICAQ